MCRLLMIASGMTLLARLSTHTHNCNSHSPSIRVLPWERSSGVIMTWVLESSACLLLLQSAADASSRAAVAASAAAAAVAVTKAAAARAATKAAHAARAATGSKQRAAAAAAASSNGAASLKQNGASGGGSSQPSGDGAPAEEGESRDANSTAVTADDLKDLSQIEQQLLSGQCCQDPE